MAKKMLIDATHAEETRVVVVDGNKVEEFDFETAHRRQLAGNIYLAKVTRVEPSLQAAFVDYGGNRHGFLAFAEIHPDYYQIPVADRKALLEEERAYARSQNDDNGNGRRKRSDRRKSDEAAGATDAEQQSGEAETPVSADAPAVAEAVLDTASVSQRDIGGMDIVDLDADDEIEAAPIAPNTNGARDEEDDAEPYRAADHATEIDDQIESVADEDVSDEVRPARRQRPRRYKIQEVVKVRQIMLVQVVKEERGNKGAALTTYLSLAGRYCVLMPNTARGGGISRKITNAVDRKKLKDIAGEMEVPEGAGLIIRTAGANRTRAEIKRDYEYLFRLWEQIRDLTLKSVAPAPIYEEGDLIKRSIRDLYSREIDEVLVEGEAGYRVAKDFMKMIMPSHAKNVKLYGETLPLFARFQVESYLGAMFNPTVQLKSGGYIVIGVTEALVAIDINSGKSTREGSIEDTALKTNLEAADEIARQLRLRDLAGLIVIDFIDMEERKNNAAVEKRLKEKLKNDRARIQVGRISGFGLLEMSRQRLRPGMLEATTQPCPHCHGTGLIRSDNSLALSILRALEEEGTRAKTREALVRAPVGIVNYLFNVKREHLAQIEARYGMAIRIEADPSLVSPDFAIEKFKTATRVVQVPVAPVVSLDARTMSEVDDIVDDTDVEEDEAAATVERAEPVGDTAGQSDEAGAADGGQSDGGQADGGPGDGSRRKRRRRRRRRGGQGNEAADVQSGAGEAERTDGKDVVAETEVEPSQAPAAAVEAGRSGADQIAGEEPAAVAEAPAKPVRKRRSRRKVAEDAPEASEATAPEAPEDVVATTEAEKPAPKPRTRRKRTPKPAPVEADTAVEAAGAASEGVMPATAESASAEDGQAAVEQKPEDPTPAADTDQPEPVQSEPEADSVAPPSPEAAEDEEKARQPEPVGADAGSEPAKPRRRGWWSLGR
ncbi:ribonuclease E/G [Pararhodobacter sp. SW119]|uniref:ribonuclease E/G n=1 Tax=Pararhodobacter sp. SW119 TaxID=2780075 RepID=UPI001ADF5625|nr:ribonuclease E/G [Pararhodobacter sp. SW119]